MALSDNRRQRIFTFCALYFAQGIPWGFMLLTLPSYLLDTYGEFFGDDEIGRLKAIILIPWSFKLIWAPIMDSFTIRSMGRRRPWIIGAELLMAFTLLGLIGLGDLSNQLRALLLMYFVHNCFASLQDVCTDAMAVDLLPANEQGQLNGLMWGSKLVGKAGGAWVLSYVINWGGIEACVAVQVTLLLLIILVPLYVLERPGERRFPWSTGAAQGNENRGLEELKMVVLDQIKRFSLPRDQRSDITLLAKICWPAISLLLTIAKTIKAFGVLTLVVYVAFTLTKLIGTGVNEVVANTLFIKQLGWSDIEFTTASGPITILPVILGTFLGGTLADRYGRRLIICLGYGGFAVATIAFASLPEYWNNTVQLAVPASLQSIVGSSELDVKWFGLSYIVAYETLTAIGAVGFLSMAMRISWSKSAATVFTVYMTLSNVSHVVGNWLAGPIRTASTDYVNSAGIESSAAVIYSYQLTFWFCGLTTLPVLLLLLWVRTESVDKAEQHRLAVEAGEEIEA